MRIRNYLLVGTLLVLTGLTADAQGRRGGVRSFNNGNAGWNNGWGGSAYTIPGTRATIYNSPFTGPGLTFGSPYNNSGYTYGSPYNNSGYTYGSPYYGQGQTYGSPYYGQGQTYGSPYYGTPSRSQSFYYSTPSAGTTYYYSTPAVTGQSSVIPATSTLPVETTTSSTPAGEMGLRITEVKENGGAKLAGFNAGDIIMKVDDRRVQSFEGLREALTQARKSEVNVEFIDGTGTGMQKRKVKVDNTRIGVVIEEVPVARR